MSNKKKARPSRSKKEITPKVEIGQGTIIDHGRVGSIQHTLMTLPTNDKDWVISSAPETIIVDDVTPEVILRSGVPVNLRTHRTIHGSKDMATLAQSGKVTFLTTAEVREKHSTPKYTHSRAARLTSDTPSEIDISGPYHPKPNEFRIDQKALAERINNAKHVSKPAEPIHDPIGDLANRDLSCESVPVETRTVEEIVSTSSAKISLEECIAKARAANNVNVVVTSIPTTPSADTSPSVEQSAEKVARLYTAEELVALINILTAGTK